MSEVASSVGAAVPWALIFALITMLFRARLSGDPALWKRVEALEQKLEEQRRDFDAKMEAERMACAKHISDLEGQIRDLQQRQSSFGAMSNKPLCGALDVAYPAPAENGENDDLLAQLGNVEGTGRDYGTQA